MEKVYKLKSILSQLDDCLDSLHYDLSTCSSSYSEEDVELLKYAIIDISHGYRNLFNIINHE